MEPEQIKQAAYLKAADGFARVSDPQFPMAALTAFVAAATTSTNGHELSLANIDGAILSETDPAKVAALTGEKLARQDRLTFLSAISDAVQSAMNLHDRLTATRKADLNELRAEAVTAA